MNSSLANIGNHEASSLATELIKCLNLSNKRGGGESSLRHSIKLSAQSAAAINFGIRDSAHKNLNSGHILGHWCWTLLLHLDNCSPPPHTHTQKNNKMDTSQCADFKLQGLWQREIFCFQHTFTFQHSFFTRSSQTKACRI